MTSGPVTDPTYGVTSAPPGGRAERLEPSDGTEAWDGDPPDGPSGGEPSDGEPSDGEPSGDLGPGSTGRRVAVVAVALLALVGAFLLGGQLLRPGTPGDTSPEAGFARDMQTHHNQAVEMSLVVREKSTDPVLRAVAYDIATSQSQQAGQMFAWLGAWGLSQTSSQPAMTWMAGAVSQGHSDMAGMAGMATSGSSDGSMLLPDGRMPGMASAADLARLRAATGRDAEVLFLQLMVVHHRGGVEMAQAIEQRTSRPEVLAMARSIVAAQTSEISQMNDLLTARGATAA